MGVAENDQAADSVQLRRLSGGRSRGNCKGDRAELFAGPYRALHARSCPGGRVHRRRRGCDRLSAGKRCLHSPRRGSGGRGPGFCGSARSGRLVRRQRRNGQDGGARGRGDAARRVRPCAGRAERRRLPDRRRGRRDAAAGRTAGGNTGGDSVADRCRGNSRAARFRRGARTAQAGDGRAGRFRGDHRRAATGGASRAGRVFPV